MASFYLSNVVYVTRQLVIDFSISLDGSCHARRIPDRWKCGGKKTVEFERLRHYASCSVLNTMRSIPPMLLYTLHTISGIFISNRKTGREGEEGAVVGCERLLRPLRPTGCRRRHNEQKTRMTKETYFESNTVIRANILLLRTKRFRKEMFNCCATSAASACGAPFSKCLLYNILSPPPPQKYEQEMYNLCCFSSNQGVKASSTRLLMD